MGALSVAARRALEAIVAYRAEVPFGPGLRVGTRAVPRLTALALAARGLVELTTETGKSETTDGAYKNASGARIAPVTSTRYFASETYAKATAAGLAALATEKA